jgi:hypothetical protein
MICSITGTFGSLLVIGQPLAGLQVLQETLWVSMLRILRFLSDCCLKTEVFKQH